jgi:outer membrane protein TolC
MRVVVPTIARVAAGVVCWLVLGAPAGAQPAAPMQAPTPAGPVRQLTIDEAVRLALEHNLALRVERINPEIQQQNVLQAQTAWAPTLTGNMFYNNTDTPPDSLFSGTNQTLKTDNFTGSGGVSQLLPWGANWSATLDGRRTTSNSIFNDFNPTLRANLNLGYTQPLLRNREIDSSRQQLIISARNREISDVTLRGTVTSTIRDVKNAYWDLKYTIANLEVQKQSLDLARQTLKDNRTRVEVGTMAPIDIVEAEAEVARNEENVIVAEANIKTAEDSLRTLIFDPATPQYWSLRIDPIDPPAVQPSSIDVEAAVTNALQQRTDLQQAKKSLENVESNLKFYKNQTLPQVNLELDFTTTGLGGTQFEREPGFPPGPVIAEISRGFGSVLGDVFTADYPGWQVGVAVSYPLGRSAAETSYARSLLELNQGKLQIQNLELQVGSQVRNVGRQVNTNAQRVQATRASRVLAERRLEAEQKKFGVGTSTSFLVFQAQRDLATARANELRALLDYNQSLTDFEAIQLTAISGGGITLSGSGQALSTTQGTQTATALTQGQGGR